MFISEYLKPKKSLAKLGIFDVLLDKDSNFFINIIRLKMSTVPEFIEAYNHLNSFLAILQCFLMSLIRQKCRIKCIGEQEVNLFFTK